MPTPSTSPLFTCPVCGGHGFSTDHTANVYQAFRWAAERNEYVPDGGPEIDYTDGPGLHCANRDCAYWDEYLPPESTRDIPADLL